MVMQERLFFRNIPLSNWIEHEMIVEEGRDLDQLPQESIFQRPALASETRLPISKLLNELTVQEPKPRREPAREPAREAAVLVASHVPAFGAQ
jgi:hypothetical protein